MSWVIRGSKGTNNHPCVERPISEFWLAQQVCYFVYPRFPSCWRPEINKQIVSEINKQIVSNFWLAQQVCFFVYPRLPSCWRPEINKQIVSEINKQIVSEINKQIVSYFWLAQQGWNKQTNTFCGLISSLLTTYLSVSLYAWNREIKINSCKCFLLHVHNSWPTEVYISCVKLKQTWSPKSLFSCYTILVWWI